MQTVLKQISGTDYAHTNDATAFAMGRTLVAIIENYQNKDGTIRIPEVYSLILGGQSQL
jgi:seryl-tRNA synthetase